MKWISPVIFLILFTPRVNAMSTLEALSMIESNDRDRARGRHGEVSRYQILPHIWKQFGGNGFNPRDPRQSRVVAEFILQDRIRVFVRVTKRFPVDYEIYALWNCPGLLYQHQWDWTRLPPKIKERCQRFHNLMISQ